MKYSLLLGVVMAGLMAAGCSKHPSHAPAPAARQTVSQRPDYPEADQSQVVDLSRFYQDRLGKDMAGVAHRQTIDGLVFHIDGRVVTYGINQARWDNRGKKEQPDLSSHYPDRIGIPVGRAFDELHLIHATFWPDVDGETIALIRLNYADGSKKELPIIFGAHVRDFQRIRTEEKEDLSDPDTKVVWRGDGISSFKSTQRLFKSKLANPNPDKVVTTMDVVSTRHLAAYQLLAATTAKTDLSRKLTPPVPTGEAERFFDGTVTVSVKDAAHDRLLPHVLVEPFMDVDGPYMVAAPFYTDEHGQGIIRYPKDRTQHMSIRVGKRDYAETGTNWAGTFPDSASFTLTEKN